VLDREIGASSHGLWIGRSGPRRTAGGDWNSRWRSTTSFREEGGYRSNLRAMLDHVVATEGPIYFDVLIDRIARAHGFQRSGETVQRIIRAALGRHRFPATADGDREIIWPKDVVPEVKAPYRGTGGREHGDVPLPELAGLADVLRAQGLEDEEDLIRGIQEHFGLGRLAISTRHRFEAAVRAQ
jgi:hypothetical protein